MSDPLNLNSTGALLQQYLPLVTSGGALAGLLPSILSWFEKRGLDSKRTQALAVAQQRVEFLNAWVKGQEPLCSPESFAKIKRSVAEEMIEIKAHLNEVLEEAGPASKDPIKEKPFLQ